MTQQEFNEIDLKQVNKKRTYVLMALGIIILLLIANAWLLWSYQQTGAELTEVLKECNPYEICEQVASCEGSGFQELPVNLG